MYTAIMFTYGSLMIEVIGKYLDERIELIITQYIFTTNYIMAVNYYPISI